MTMDSRKRKKGHVVLMKWKQKPWYFWEWVVGLVILMEFVWCVV